MHVDPHELLYAINQILVSSVFVIDKHHSTFFAVFCAFGLMIQFGHC